MDKQNIITVKNLEKKYKLYNKKSDRLLEATIPWIRNLHTDFLALKDISFEVAKGETVGIIGTNGSGKSTLLKILTKVVTPTNGYIFIDGKISALLELGAGFNREYTGIQNIYLNGTLMGFTKEEMDLKVDAIIDFADIGEFLYQPVKNYSSGMFARLAFAVAINVEPDILIVDEALSVGDVFFQNKCFRKFEELKEKGVTILFVSHDIESVKMMCQRTLWIEKGVQKMFGSSIEVCNAYATSILGKNNESANIDGEIKKSYKIEKFEMTSFPGIVDYGKESILNDKVEIKSFFFSELGRNNAVYTLTGGKKYTLNIIFNSMKNLENVIVGFTLQNKKGLRIINTNSLVVGQEGTFKIKAKHMYRVEFEFVFPYLESNEYILDCAVAQGTKVNDSCMLTWLYGALRVFVNNPLGNLGLFDVAADIKVLEKKM